MRQNRHADLKRVRQSVKNRRADLKRVRQSVKNRRSDSLKIIVSAKGTAILITITTTTTIHLLESCSSSFHQAGWFHKLNYYSTSYFVDLNPRSKQNK
eukprot:g76831.t1